MIFALIFSISGVSKERSVMSRISSERPHILVDDGLVDDGFEKLSFTLYQMLAKAAAGAATDHR